MEYESTESQADDGDDPLPVGLEPQIEIANRQRRYRLDTPALRRFVGALLEDTGHAGHGLHVSFLRDPAMRELNQTTFGIDKPTNVISFPLGEMPGDPVRLLGDVVVSVDTAAREAAAAGMPLERRLAELVIHGYLHILGYEHVGVDDAERKRMRRAEKRTYARLEAWVIGRLVKKADHER